jgi:hypothetical protein
MDEQTTPNRVDSHFVTISNSMLRERTRRNFDSLDFRLGLRYPRGFAVHVARPTRSIFFVILPIL